MKYVTTHYPTFFRKSIIPTGVSIVLTLASFVQGWPLVGSGIAIVTLSFLWAVLRSCQIRLTVTEQGVGFTKGKYHTAYPWACIESVTCWPEMTEFRLVGTSFAALFPAFDIDGREREYQTIQAVIFILQASQHSGHPVIADVGRNGMRTTINSTVDSTLA